jgi:hypothetical protein
MPTKRIKPRTIPDPEPIEYPDPEPMPEPKPVEKDIYDLLIEI